MSGTSLDGLDIAVVDIDDHSHQLIAAETIAYQDALYQQLANFISHPSGHIRDYAELDISLGQFIGQQINVLLQQHAIPAQQIAAIGSHGHTVFHQPEGSLRFSLQIGNGHHIAQLTGITTVTDFRQRDMAEGGQGAPLVPAFHQAVFAQPFTAIAVINIGGIANITVLNEQAVIGFDTGPGNGLLDSWIQTQLQQPYDDNGQWAAQGECQSALLEQMLGDDYFQQAIPKSTGKEYFNLGWIQRQLADYGQTVSTVDVQATLLQLTAVSIAQSVEHHATDCRTVYLCGGGVCNTLLVQAIQACLPEHQITDTGDLGIDPDWVEAVAFAWLAKQTLSNNTSNLPSVTGANKATILGAIHPV